MSGSGATIHGDPIAPVILGVTSILAFAIIGRVSAKKLRQPTVLGELLMGIALGNIAWYLGFDLIAVLREGPRVFDVVNEVLAGNDLNTASASIFGEVKGAEIAAIIESPHGGQVLQVAHAVDVFSRYGVIFLLFMVGLETDLKEMRRVGGDSIRVAILGVALPLSLGLAGLSLLEPELSLNSSLFIAATLGATSIGISADVLKEMDHSQTREGRTVLGAAVADDILGLLILAIVSGFIVSGSVDIVELVLVILGASLFIVAAFLLGPAIVRLLASIMARLDLVEAKMFTSYVFVMILAWSANLSGLATIIGAFAAGIVLHDGYFKDHEGTGFRTLSAAGDEDVVAIRELIMPLEVILVPIFFILMGMQVKLESFLSMPVLILAGVLTIAAVAGKLLSGAGARAPANKLVIGIGMMPRGEVGLVFAAIGRTLGVIDDSVFTAIVFMVFVTTLATPPLLKAAISWQGRRQRMA